MIYAKFFLTKYNKLTQIKLYKIAKNNNLTSSNIFEWHKNCPEHIHFLALIKKRNRNNKISWKCSKCSKYFNNNDLSFYYSVCDYSLCFIYLYNSKKNDYLT